MRKALLIADGRPLDNPNDLGTIATQRLIEQYPVTVSRHFMYRFNALMKFMLNNDQILNGRKKKLLVENRIPKPRKPPCPHGSLGRRSRII